MGREKINWTVEDAAMMHASVLIAAAGACQLTDEKGEAFLRHIAVSLLDRAEFTSPHVAQALTMMSHILYETAPPRLCEVVPFKRAN